MTTINTESGRPQRRRGWRVAGINDARYKSGRRNSRTGDDCLLLVWECEDARGDAR